MSNQQLSAEAGQLHMADDINQRGIDLLTPVYNMLDLTPGGRDDWYAELSYQPRTTVEVDY